jgi:transcriptional regulator with XRE-family HTH domain
MSPFLDPLWFLDNKTMSGIRTPDELEVALGENLKALRLNKNIDQKSLAERAGISVRALKNLENGLGSTLKSFTAVLRALGREEWLDSIAPVASINPLTLTRDAQPRQRARPRPRREST